LTYGFSEKDESSLALVSGSRAGRPARDLNSSSSNLRRLRAPGNYQIPIIVKNSKAENQISYISTEVPLRTIFHRRRIFVLVRPSSCNYFHKWPQQLRRGWFCCLRVWLIRAQAPSPNRSPRLEILEEEICFRLKIKITQISLALFSWNEQPPILATPLALERICQWIFVTDQAWVCLFLTTKSTLI